MNDLVRRSAVVLRPDPQRVVARLFVPGHERFSSQESRATGVLGRLLGMSEEQVRETLADVVGRFTGRHRDLPGVLRSSWSMIAHRVPDADLLSAERRDLVGAVFTHEFSVEGAALFNPSAVPHPDQDGLRPGQVRFVMSLRAVGEGHLSCIEFRCGVFGPGDEIVLEPSTRHAETTPAGPTHHDRELFAAILAEGDADTESTRYLLSRLDPVFGAPELEEALVSLAGQGVTRHGASYLVDAAREIAGRSYELEFPEASTLEERVLWPTSPSERSGLEDARFVRFTDLAEPTFRATYTAFDGTQIVPRLIETADFRRFRVSPMTGPAARDKGMALFPRTVGGRHLALTRSDRETIGLASSPDGRHWDEPVLLHAPSRPWELVQLGNCGSPVETAAGWLVLTHGVGPVREYVIGALLLDLDDPSRVLGALREPLLRPQEDEREGYVPNVVYSCGAMLHGDRLLLPYGASDDVLRFAVVDVPGLLARLLEDGPAEPWPDATRENSSA